MQLKLLLMKEVRCYYKPSNQAKIGSESTDIFQFLQKLFIHVQNASKAPSTLPVPCLCTLPPAPCAAAPHPQHPALVQAADAPATAQKHINTEAGKRLRNRGPFHYHK